MWQVIKKALGLPTWPAKAARQAFRQSHPEQHFGKTILAADEDDRFVVCVLYGSTRPPRRIYYAVSKITGEVAPLDDDSAYRPKIDR